MGESGRCGDSCFGGVVLGGDKGRGGDSGPRGDISIGDGGARGRGAGISGGRRADDRLQLIIEKVIEGLGGNMSRYMEMLTFGNSSNRSSRCKHNITYLELC